MLIPLGHRQYAPNGASFDRFLNIPPRFLVFVQEDMNLVRAAEEIVKISHDVLVSAHQKESEVISFAGPDPMQRQGFFYILQIDELAYFAVRIARNIRQGPVAVRRLIQMM